ncbi:transglutaminase-like cysteine peptidase [Ferrimonas lipolytica]|uniref:Sulfate adenylyltransferase n=1 Tax=Ferrimonas lipolytica TaxID=2724191 RepID=A0A6H1UID5_9GAMM|nr:transglutaminase-like cysteine peptidase [Ferrimonas lipolytica]QIZ77976.1 sulfate adenylyltransferase [Ferrimonas lipolytica]
MVCSFAAVAEPTEKARWHRFFSEPALSAVEQQYGQPARVRVSELYQWLQQELAQAHSVPVQLDRVNRYLNQLQFVADSEHWQQADYWATPVEMVATGGGDCEDFTIAKYFILRILGVPSEQLRLMYVKAVELNQAHMVLLYLSSPDAMPLVLDNLQNEIKTGAERADLVPVYSFNAEGLWRARAFDQGVLLKSGDNGVDLWGDLLQRMNREEQG